jgi:hypothetical protein
MRTKKLLMPSARARGPRADFFARPFVSFGVAQRHVLLQFDVQKRLHTQVLPLYQQQHVICAARMLLYGYAADGAVAKAAFDLSFDRAGDA